MKQYLKWGGIGAVILGSGALFLSGTGESMVAALVGAIFVLGGIIAGMFKA
jgi:hypothetical protein